MCDSRGPERPLPVTTDSQNGSVGEASVHSHPPAASLHEATTV